MDFPKRYANLNDQQKIAVDTIDGPVMVIAGPGTGKTELLSVRTANILKITDTLPENILCLTFTDSGANAMRERLTEIIGKDAYKVAIHTFHSFGSEVINQNGQFFYQGAHFMPADELSKYEIIREIFDNLDYNNPISSKLNDEYTHLSDVMKVISELKQSSLTSDELLKILDSNNEVIEKAEQILSPIFSNGINKSTALQASECITKIRESGGEISLSTIIPLSTILSDSLENATNNAMSQNSTKPITAWRNEWFKKDISGKFILKSRERQSKLRAVSFVYERYLSRMQESVLYDFDDMILRVVHAMEVFNDLRFNLQEKYQYIMVDEFQDTNMAQMRIIHNLTNNEAHGDTPNILVVGDDDQAIYSFQGADISNIIDFQKNYPKVKQITLTDNYRSSSDILNSSRDIIIQGHNRLENLIDGIDKKLKAINKFKNDEIHLYEAETINDERHFIVNDIKSRIKAGEKPNEIALLTRRHGEINDLLPYFNKLKISVNYERRDNVLELPLIILIEKLASLLINLSKGLHDDVNAEIPEILAHKSWGIEPKDLWKLSSIAYDNRSRWLDVMAENNTFKPIYNWIVTNSSMVYETPLETMLDIIIGKPNDTKDTNSELVSPIYKFYFSKDALENDPNKYLTYLEALRTIRSKLREYRPNQTPTLSTFIEFIKLNRKIGSTISVIRQSIESDSAVNIMTSHKSKGLEFKTVYIMNSVDSVWGEKARSRNRMISYPENLQLQPAGETEDERLRLFYVAATRAKQNLIISYSLSNDNGKKTLRASFLVNSKLNADLIDSPENIEQQTESTELAWYQPLVDPASNNLKQLLTPILENYKLSVTHLNNFLDVTRGGPATFLLNNLLHFPSAKSPNAAFGTAIHETLQKAHAHMSSTGKMQPSEDIISNFEKYLKNQHIIEADFNTFLQKGIDSLQVFLDKKSDTFTAKQKTELNFNNQHSIIGIAHITGKIDLVDIDEKNKTMIVTDYKTGKPSSKWSGSTDYEKIKLHKYKQQLLFYKLLVENARDYRKYKVKNGIMQFIEPTKLDEIMSLDISFDDSELKDFVKLINSVWQKIKSLDLPDISGYEQSHKGILAFEKDLIDSYDL